MRIVIVTNGLYPVPSTRGGGAETLIQDLLNQNEIYQKVNFLVYSIYDDKALEESKKYKFSQFKFLPPKKWGLKDFLFLVNHFYYKKLRRFEIYKGIYDFDKVLEQLESEEFDFIVIENTLVPFKKIVERYSNRVFVHVHNELFKPTLPEKQKELYCRLINNCGGIITVSNYIKNLALQMQSLDESKFHVLLNSVNISSYIRDLDFSLKRKMDLENKIVFTYFGRICEEKGVLEILRAFSMIKSDDVRLMIIGNVGNMDDEFSKNIKKLINQDKRVIATGYVRHEDLGSYLKLSSCAVLPSKCQDACPLTIIESMASSLPIITTKVGGIPEIVNYNCAIILENDSKLEYNLYQSMLNISKDSQLRKIMSKASSDIACPDGFFDLNSFYNRFICIMKGNDNG